MDSNTIEKIRDSIDILELINEYVPAIRKSGRTHKACCPFHQEKTPSFTISPDKGLFYCFGCQAGGDVFAFLMRAENLSFNEAARKLAERAGIEWQQEEAMTEDEKQRLKYYKIMDFAREFYHSQLMSADGEAARTYIKKRNLTKETVQKFQLGFAKFDGLVKKAIAAGHNLQDLKKLGLASSSTGTDYFKNRLMFSIFNHRGETVAFGGRVMGEGQPKYLNSPETMLFSKSRLLYALNFAGPAIRKEEHVILLEGYMDVIAVHQAGVENCVAPLGTSFTLDHAKLLKRYTSNAVVVFDPDTAGTNAALRAASILIESGLYVKVVTLPEGLDPDDYINKYSSDEFIKLVKNGRDIINFQADILLKGHAELGPQDKTNIASLLCETISKQPDEIIKREWAKITADRLNIDADVILAKVSSAKPGRATLKPQVKETYLEPQDNTPRIELDLIKVLLKFPRYVEMCNNLQSHHFKNQKMWSILKGIEKIRTEEPNVENVAALLIRQMPQEEQVILKLSVDDMPKYIKPTQDIEVYLKALDKAAITAQLKTLQQKLKEFPAGSVPLDLLKEQIELQKKLKS